MRSARPKAPAWRGVVDAAGFLVDAALTGETEARRRILALWEPGATVHRVARGWLIRLPRTRRVRCDQAPGLPLTAEKVPVGRALVSAPFTPEDLRAIDPPDGALVRLWAGDTLVERPSQEDRVDPAAWLDISAFVVTPMVTLGAPPVTPRPPAREAAAFDLRARLRGVPPPAPELAEVLAALSRRKSGGAEAGGTARGGVASLGDWLHGLRWSLRRRPAVASRPAGPGTRELILAGAGPPPRGPGLGERLRSLLHQMAERTAVASLLSQVMGRRHAAYIQQMMELFERGELREALRYAIPLGGAAGEALRGFPLRLPGPRRDLEIRPGIPRTHAALPTSNDLYDELQRLYRTAFERLAAQGHIEEAAFLLADVLLASEEAVAFLERHGRMRLAAEMAEARNLPPGLVVRQWFLAGDRQRALRTARRTGAFADAVTRLERSRRHQEAQALRLVWGHDLAEAGAYVAAVEAVWPVPEAHRLALRWMDRAIEQGGAPAGRMIARKLALVPDEFETTRDQAVMLLESWRAEGASARLAFAETLRQGPRTPETMTLARAAVRTVARDSGRFGARMAPDQFRRLVTFADDGALRADAPALPLPDPGPWVARDTPWTIEIGPSDVGVMAACDAAFLPNGLTLVALGEAGVRLISRAGRTVAEVDQPAHRLVVSDSGNRALALAPRGDSWRLARIDLAARKGEIWCDARFDAAATDYDGVVWFVAAADGLVAIEATGRSFDGSWGVPDLGRRVGAIVRSPQRCSLLTTGADPEVWTYEIPSLFLRSRAEVPETARPASSRCLGIAAEGQLAEQWIASAPNAPAETSFHVQTQARSAFELRLPGTGWSSGLPVLSGDWLAAPVHSAEEARLYLIHRPTAKLKAEVILARARQLAVRLTPAYLTLADDRGRVLVLDLEYGQIRRDVRL
ncbi:MAG TPA: bpX6 domain-containing protein [Thermoanaerobaculia bacterium]|nr:bpX6 domain-containing protein [Thermoanaerobaculia bacterium]